MAIFFFKRILVHMSHLCPIADGELRGAACPDDASSLCNCRIERSNVAMADRRCAPLHVFSKSLKKLKGSAMISTVVE